MKTRKQIPDAHMAVESQLTTGSHAKSIIQEYNNLYASQKKRRQQLLQKLFGRFGLNSAIDQPFQCEYGYNIYIGKNFYANTGCLFDDYARIVIGDNVMLGPNVGIYTSAHPFSVKEGVINLIAPIVIGNDVWIGGNVIIMPGVIIGNNSMIGAGSVVLNNIPPDVIAVGNPAKPIKKMIDL
ncbi:MAG: sugar O-acetyltransferase [Prevotella sp.]|jgi:acetyltransferase-like isoleucine patch superfamily enzyme|nr:sugar O-acetyltransferase [Prevotella sp.]